MFKQNGFHVYNKKGQIQTVSEKPKHYLSECYYDNKVEYLHLSASFVKAYSTLVKK